MKQCQICFQVATDVYIAPSLLPAQETVEMAVEQVWRGSLPKAEVCLKYTFLHEGVLRAMLCNIGQIAGVHAVYWAYGVCFYDIEKRSTVRIGSTLPDAASGQTSGSITVEATGPKATQLATHITNSIQRLNIGQPPQIIWKSGQADQISQNAYEEVAEANDEAFAEVKPALPPRLEGEAMPVYVSYSWEGESEELVDTFERRIPTNFKLIRDKRKMRPGDWISKFMAEIGRAERVLVVLSDKYLRSVYCMKELLHLYNTCLGDRGELMRRIVPLIVGDLKCARARDRDVYVTHWEEEFKALDEILQKRNFGNVGDADRSEWLMIQDFQHHVSDILAWMADTLMPQGADVKTKGIDAAIELFEQRSSY